jgi:hypothetical protein
MKSGEVLFAQEFLAPKNMLWDTPMAIGKDADGRFWSLKEKDGAYVFSRPLGNAIIGADYVVLDNEGTLYQLNISKSGFQE